MVEESFPSSVLASLPIAAEQGDRVLVDATAFLLADTEVLPALRAAGVGEWKQDPPARPSTSTARERFPETPRSRPSLTFVAEKAPAAVAAVLPDGRTMSLRLHHTFLKLPEPGYRPRALDPRIGFIPLRRLDHTAPFDRADREVPRDRAGGSRRRTRTPRSPSRSQPIVYYLDRGMPEPERAAIREAALWWNHAFEQAGFRRTPS